MFVANPRTQFVRRTSSAFGTKQTYRDICRLSAFGGKADIGFVTGDVRS